MKTPAETPLLSQSSKLPTPRPCPLCGNEDIVYGFRDGDNPSDVNRAFVMCGRCNVAVTQLTTKDRYPRRALFICLTRWNHRHSPKHVAKEGPGEFSI